MFYFTRNENKIYESFTFWNKLQEKNNFHDILILFFNFILFFSIFFFFVVVPVWSLQITAAKNKTK